MDIRKFFKAYDMRGTFGTDFDLDTVRRIGAALPGVLGAKRWLVGRDGRTTGESVRDALIDGLSQGGAAEICDLGLCTTPMVYFFTAEDGFDASVMITASHNPERDNGLKVSRAGAIPVGFSSGLDEVCRIVCDGGNAAPANRGAGACASRQPPSGDTLERYVKWQEAATDDAAFANMRYAVDCSSGVAALLAERLFPGAALMNTAIDGSFPAHSPNPLDPDSRKAIAQAVRDGKLDCGIIFDGDADRAMFVDENGDFVQPDYLIPAVFEATRCAAGGETPSRKPVVLHDVRTSRGTVETLRELGAEPVMVPVGHVFAKREMRERGALCGGELAGHYYFSEFHNCDSGILAARRILCAAARAKSRGLAFSQMVAPVRDRYANSGEINFRVADKQAAVGRVIEAARNSLPPERSHSRLDGIRFEYDDGWFNIRSSNTEPFLRLVAECKTREQLADWLGILKGAITQ